MPRPSRGARPLGAWPGAGWAAAAAPLCAGACDFDGGEVLESTHFADLGFDLHSGIPPDLQRLTTTSKQLVDYFNMDKLVAKHFFVKPAPAAEAAALAAAISCITVGEHIATDDYYAALNRAGSSNYVEGVLLLRVSKLCSAICAVVMGFMACFLQTLGVSNGWVYASMGVIIGSAMGHTGPTILKETANSIFFGDGAIGGLILGLEGWLKAHGENVEICYEALGQANCLLNVKDELGTKRMICD